MLVDCEAVDFLKALIQSFTNNKKNHQAARLIRVRWVIAKFPNFDKDQREMRRARKIGFLKKFLRCWSISSPIGKKLSAKQP